MTWHTRGWCHEPMALGPRHCPSGTHGYRDAFGVVGDDGDAHLSAGDVPVLALADLQLEEPELTAPKQIGIGPSGPCAPPSSPKQTPEKCCEKDLGGFAAAALVSAGVTLGSRTASAADSSSARRRRREQSRAPHSSTSAPHSLLSTRQLPLGAFLGRLFYSPGIRAPDLTPAADRRRRERATTRPCPGTHASAANKSRGNYAPGAQPPRRARPRPTDPRARDGRTL